MRLLFLTFLLIFNASVLFAASTTKYPDPNRVTVFNKIADNLATMGQDPQDARQTIADRKRERKVIRQHAINREKRIQTHKRMQQQNKEI